MNESNTHLVDVRGGQLPLWVRPGAEPTLVFLHYWGGSHRTFGPVIANLTSGCGVVTYDHRGWGTARELPGPYGIRELADDALDVVHRLGIESFVLVGHSMGGKVAQIVASRRPPELRGLVLVAPGAPHSTIDSQEAERRSHAYDNPSTVSAALDRALTYRPLSAELREQVMTDSLAANPEAVPAWPLGGMIESITDIVGQIDVPVLVLAGEHDRVDSPDALRDDLLPFDPTARMTIVDATGHLSPLEVPHQIATGIDRFITSLEPRT